MGIRCYCPNGHRLNIKSFLAGKKGVCPHCDARFRIPLESEPKREEAPGASQAPATPAPAPTVPVAAPVQAPHWSARQLPCHQCSDVGSQRWGARCPG